MTYSRYYAMGDDGKFYEVERLRNIQINTKDNEETHDVDFAKKLTGEVMTFTFKLDNRKDRTTWSKIFMMPKWEATEFCFPKKKKRGMMRRRRRERRVNEIDNIR